jgi:hypothetical protein
MFLIASPVLFGMGDYEFAIVSQFVSFVFYMQAFYVYDREFENGTRY